MDTYSEVRVATREAAHACCVLQRAHVVVVVAAKMVESGRLVVSTKCGHVFCSQCLRDALRRSLTCPTCRKRLTPRQYHPLYI